MKEVLINAYNDDLLMIFDSSKLKDNSYKALAVIKNDVEKKEIEGVLTFNYCEDFESQLNYKIPPKTRKPLKLISYKESWDMISRIAYATIGCVIDDMPYTYPLNYIVLNGHIYFHTGRKGYKLAGVGNKASVNIVEDLGLAENGSHNFRSVQLYGTLKPTEDHDLKKEIFEKYINDLNPNHPPYVESMQQTTLVYEIDIDYMMGRANIFLPQTDK